jgi:hypothetical protein
MHLFKMAVITVETNMLAIAHAASGKVEAFSIQLHRIIAHL